MPENIERVPLNVRVSKDLLSAAKYVAKLNGVTLQEFVNVAVEDSIRINVSNIGKTALNEQSQIQLEEATRSHEATFEKLDTYLP